MGINYSSLPPGKGSPSPPPLPGGWLLHRVAGMDSAAAQPPLQGRPTVCVSQQKEGSNLPSTQQPSVKVTKIWQPSCKTVDSSPETRRYHYPAPSQTLLYQSFIRPSSRYFHLGISLQSKDTSAICHTPTQAEL